jgi:hypothetical protein
MEVFASQPERGSSDNDAQRDGYGGRSLNAELARHDDDGEGGELGAPMIPKLQRVPLLSQFLWVGVFWIFGSLIDGQVGNLRNAGPDHPHDDARGEPPVIESVHHEVKDHRKNRDSGDSDGERVARGGLAVRTS